MEELRVSPKDLKQIIENSQVMGQGYFGIVLLYEGILIKLDKFLYSMLKSENKYYSRKIIEKYYDNNHVDFQDRKQIETLYNMQSEIELTKMPKGILSLKEVSEQILDISPGVILPYHQGYEKLEKLHLSEYKQLLVILKNLLLAVKELEDHKISQEDLSSYGPECIINDRNYNVMYKGGHPEIIDMGGFFVKAGSDFKDAKNMYRSLSDILLDYYYFYHIHTPIVRGKAITFKENEYLLDNLSQELKKR